MIHTNFLIIGSGVAGMTLAIKLAEYFPSKTITIVTKVGESNTRFAQGGVAVVLDKDQDSFQKHIDDTLRAGDGLCDLKVVQQVVKQGPIRVNELLAWGTRFDRDPNEELLLCREGGHTQHRIVHHLDATGREIERALTKKIQALENIKVLEHCFAIDLQTRISSDDGKQVSVTGAYIFNQNSLKIFFIQAQTTTMATGGIGQLYAHTTNPSIATGDGIAMALRAKAEVSAMEFIQFHPTVYFEKGSGTSFLISEAVRGHGAYLRNSKAYRFTLDYDPRGELASRDIVSRAIHSELVLSKEKCVYLDCTHLDHEEFKKQFPTIYDTCLQRGIDVSKDWIPVVPAVHYLCGGIVVDPQGKTSLMNLFACGECSSTGLHGANRLASNSLLEALVYAHSIFDFHRENFSEDHDLVAPIQNRATPFRFVEESEGVQQKIVQLQLIMSENAGIVRSTDQLIRTKKRLQKLISKVQISHFKVSVNTKLCEYRNMLIVAQSIIDQSIARKENKGGYFNSQL
ncbi:L-aspartate oxidase [Galbibacter sp.]|uniref:L-aspartate oxidase n=1 Tax=Galbibacter sp. TaxID=2918471 RepID=UPI003A8E38D5